MMNANIHLDRGTRIKLATEYIVADTPEEAEQIHDQIRQGIMTPNYDQYGGATVTLATDGAQTEYIAFCAKQLSNGVFGFYIINLVTMQSLPYSPFCTGRGSISNAGKWVAWRDKDYFKGLIPGFVGYPDQNARIAALEARPLPIDYSARIAQLEQRVTDLESRPSGGGAELSAQDRAALDRLRAWLGIG